MPENSPESVLTILPAIPQQLERDRAPRSPAAILQKVWYSIAKPFIISREGERMPDGNPTQSQQHAGHSSHEFKFPPWVAQAAQFAVLLFSLAAAFTTLRGDVNNLSTDVSEIRNSLPNREVLTMQITALEKRVIELEEGSKVRVMLDQRLREDLIKAGVLK